jgi:hypothetical protein
MIKSEAAIDTAVAFLKKLKPEYLGSGSAPDNIRLETIQLSGNEWYVLLRYTISIPPIGENIAKNQLLEALSTRNYFKEFEIDAESGEVIAMRNPQSPAIANTRLAA